MAKVVAVRRLLIDDELNPLPNAEVFLDDLRTFCHADATTHCFDAEDRSDPLATAQLEGRRQVWLRINGYISMSEKTLSDIGQTMGGDE